MPSPSAADLAVALLADLVEAMSRAHTELTLVPAMAGALARHLPLRWLELGRAGEDPALLDTRVQHPGAPGPIVAARKVRGSLVASSIARGPRHLHLTRLAPDERRAPEIRRAREAGAESLALLPLDGAEGVVGHALLALGPAASGGPALSPALLTAIARVLGVAVAQLQLLGRVAAVSRRALGESRTLRSELARAVLPGEVIAASPAMRTLVHEIVPLVARQETTVLLRGETGTGKEVIARRIHALSPRAARPFLQVNCGALPESLIESALFGHERGAFTGAGERRLGFFERASGGTLLLDEIAELPRSAQVKLLRALQEGEIERVGGESTLRVDVRVIAATHRPLESMVAAGSFREDLYYRLQVFPIELPPLRERPEDLPLLARAILVRLSARFGRAAPQISTRTMTRLAAHDWPGNVRELENVIERSLVVTAGAELTLAQSFAADARKTRRPTPKPPDEIPSYRATQARAIEDALASCGGRIYGEGGAAALLGLKPTTLQSKMKKLSIRRKEPARP